MMKAIVALLISLVSMSCCAQAVLADSLFYEGDIITESLGINLNIDDDHATVNAVYLLKNRSGEVEEVDLRLSQSDASLEVDGETQDNPLILNPGERRSIIASFLVDYTGETTRTLYINPELLFDGKPSAEPTGTVLMEALLPEGVHGLAWSSREPDEETLEGSRILYTWKGIDIYPAPLTLKWSTLGFDLYVEKSASPPEISEKDQVINVEVNLKNNGDVVLKDIHVIDQYVLSNFVMDEPLVESGTRENFLFWEKQISSLEPGETVTLNYSVKYIAAIPQIHEFDLRPSIITVEGNLVSVSNRVRIKQISEIPASGPESQTTEAPEETSTSEDNKTSGSSWPLIIGIILPILVVIGGAAAYLVRRNKGDNLNKPH